LIFDVKYGDSGTLEAVAAEHGDETACIIVDPVQTAADADFLRLARKLADKHGALLVFDEIITGFRLGLGGAQGYFGVTPDVATFGKAMANGMPLSTVVGKKEVMQLAADLWISSTFGGEALSLAAAKATIEELERPETLEQLWAKGRRLMDGWRETVAGNGRVQMDGLPPIPALLFTDESGGYDAEADGTYVERMFDAGILMRRKHYAFVTVSLSDDDIDRTIEATEGAIGATAAVK
jgi:glutamate-1-semialdehyde aminotransferase